jgi:hypothetical protein
MTYGIFESPQTDRSMMLPPCTIERRNIMNDGRHGSMKKQPMLERQNNLLKSQSKTKMKEKSR